MANSQGHLSPLDRTHLTRRSVSTLDEISQADESNSTIQIDILGLHVLVYFGIHGQLWKEMKLLDGTSVGLDRLK